jgi:hypothetical protein
MISREDWEKIKDIKELDLQICSFCSKVNILNLGWKPFGKYYCEKEQKEHVLCPQLCLKVCLNIFGCELRQIRQENKQEIAVNQEYYKASCYSCSKELKGAGKHGVVKNRNNPNFWGIKSIYMILCLECVGRRFFKRMVDWQWKKWKEYKRRGYV